ncbi:MAG: hypothetical protein RLZZ553_809 [Verrucomicrobiota bacterium]|jgi:hypothetical protein
MHTAWTKSQAKTKKPQQTPRPTDHIQSSLRVLSANKLSRLAPQQSALIYERFSENFLVAAKKTWS